MDWIFRYVFAGHEYSKRSSSSSGFPASFPINQHWDDDTLYMCIYGVYGGYINLDVPLLSFCGFYTLYYIILYYTILYYIIYICV